MDNFIPLTDAHQVDEGTILVDQWGNRRIVLKKLGEDHVFLSHKNTKLKGTVWSVEALIKSGEKIFKF
jgi:hypothetical protein